MLWQNKFFLQDLIEIRSDSAAECRKGIEKKANAQSGIGWSYDPTYKVIFASPGGALPLSQARAAALQLRLPVSRENNLEAISILHPYFSKFVGRFYPLEKERYHFDPELSCQVRMLGLLHSGQQGTLYWPQFRKTAVMNDADYAVVASVAQMLYLNTNDYRGMDFKVIDISRIVGGDRALRVKRIQDVKLMTVSELSDFFAPIQAALREMLADGFQPRQPKRQPKQRPTDDPRQGDFFDS